MDRTLFEPRILPQPGLPQTPYIPGAGDFGQMMPQTGAQGAPQDPLMGILGGLGGLGGAPSPFAPQTGGPPAQGGPGGLGADPYAQIGPGGAGTGDPTLDQMLLLGRQMGPKRVRGQEKAPKAPDEGFMREAVTVDRREFGRLIVRMARDLSLLRQHEAGVPLNWKRSRDPMYVSAVFSTLVNKFANLLAGLSAHYEIEASDMPGERAAQATEDYCHQCRRYEQRTYAKYTGSGTLQRDEFWFLLTLGRLVARILPDFADQDYPYTAAILDPATTFPTFGGPKEGVIRMTREYRGHLSEVVGAWGTDEKRRKQILSRLGYDEDSFRRNYQRVVTVREYWDKWYRGVFVDDVLILPATRHHLGVVPFVYIVAVGEPRAVNTPLGMYSHMIDPGGNVGAIQMSSDMDQEEKGVSVFHYLIHTKNLHEALNTIFLIEVEKQRNPATITYQAPHLFGQDQDPLDTGIGGNSYRIMGLQQVEGVPTSPKPTDASPLVQSLQQELAFGGNLPALAGDNVGSNVSGFALQNLINSALDLIRPYKQAWEMFQALKLEMKLGFYRDLIAPVSPAMVGHKEGYGAGGYTKTPLTVDMIESVGTMVNVKLSGISPAEYPQQVAATVQAMAGGLLSQLAGMERMEVRNPDKMFAEILAEKAIQHPVIQDLLMIPNALIAQGMEDVARLWADMVIAPQLAQMMMMGMPGMGGPGGPGGGPSAGPPGGGGVGGGQSLPPDQGRNPSTPGGPPSA